MKDEVEVTVTLTGAAEKVIADLRRLREDGIERVARIRTLARIPGGRRMHETYPLNVIASGDISGALRDLNNLVEQSRVSPDLEHRLETVIRELADLTRLKSN